MLVLICCGYVRFGSKVRPRTFECVSMGSGLLLGPDCSYNLQGLV